MTQINHDTLNRTSKLTLKSVYLGSIAIDECTIKKFWNKLDILQNIR